MVAKRRASAAAATVESETKRRCQAVAKAVQSSDLLSASCKSMLAGMAPAALKTYEDDRHEYQKSIVQMVKTSLQGMQDAMQKKNAEMLIQVAKAGTIKNERSAAVSAAEADLSSKGEAMKAAQAALAESLNAVKDAKAAVKDAQSKQSKGDAQISVVASNKEAIEACKANAFIPLKEGTLAGPDAKKALQTLGNICKQFDLERLMVDATLQAFKQAPAERSSFLATSVDQLEAKLNALVSGFAEELSKGEPAKQERAAAVDAAEFEKSNAIGRADAAKAAATAAEAAKEQAANALKAAKKSLATYYPDMKKLMSASDDGPRALKAFEGGVLADFKVLETLAAPPPVVEEPVEEAAAVEEPVAVAE